MRNDKLIPGTILVIIGALFLLDNFHVINFSWSNFFHLWPIILVIAGVNLVFAHNRSATATAVKIGVLVVGMGFLVFGGLGRDKYSHEDNFGFGNNWHFDDDDNDNSSDSTGRDSIVKIEGSSHYTEVYKPQVKFARLNIIGGGSNYTLNETTDQLFEADTKEYKNKYVLKSTGDSTSATLDFDMVNNHNKKHHRGFSFNFGNTKSNKAIIRLNPNPEWEINVRTGASKIKFDLASYKIRKLELDGGAASINVKLGQPLAETNVEVSTGVSEVIISVPTDAACRITTETGLSSKSFKGFDNKSENQYETPGFAQATNKMYISLKGGVSDFKVKRY